MKLSLRKMQPEDTRGGNSVVDNFRAETLSLLEIFIREFLQNSLDNRIELAAGELQAANIKIKIVKIDDDLKQNFIDSIFDEDALGFIKSGSSSYPSMDGETYSALVIEENDTQGITGVKNKSGDYGKWAKFWHHQSSSNKTGNKNGRAGQGKISYHMISNVWSVFALSNTIEDPKKLFLMGKCILPSNPIINEIDYHANAFISHYEEISGVGRQPIPYEDINPIDSFCDAFSIKRSQEQTGTTWVFPFPRNNPQEDQIRKAIIKGYFYSILKQKLTVEVGDITLNHNSILDLASNYVDESDKNFYSFIKNCFDEEYDRVRLHSNWAGQIQLSDEVFNDKSDHIKTTFNSGKIVSFRLPIIINSKKEGRLTSHFDVYLQKHDNIVETREAFIRTDLIITDEKTLSYEPGSFYGLVVADDPAIANFLANTEIANHTKFNKAMAAAEENYTHIEETLRNIRMGAARIYRLLSKRQSQKIEDLLSELLSIKGSKEKRKKKKKKEPEIDQENDQQDKDTQEDDIDEDIESHSKRIDIRDNIGSIVIKPGVKKYSIDELPVTLRVQAGYESIDGGNPFKKHHHFDFDFTNSESISIETNHMTIINSQITPNEIYLTIDNVNFELNLTGFSEVERLRIRGTIYNEGANNE